MDFIKMEGCGNDYIYIDCFNETVDSPEALAVKLSDRHFGIGGDGLILIKPSDKADCFMDIYNASGSRAEMCGNGIRCVGKYMYDSHRVRKPVITVDTLAGVKTIALIIENDVCVGATVDMGAPAYNADTPEIHLSGTPWSVVKVSTGNPHAVMFVDDVALFPVAEVGSAIETHPEFPNGTNVHFIKVHARDSIEIRTWERGSGETLACGTGNCASLVAATLCGLSDGMARMITRGGELHIRWDRERGTVFMTGPAREVYRGRILLREYH